MTSPASRRPYRPPFGLPPRGGEGEGERDRWHGTLVSVVVHAALLALLVMPTVHSGFAGRPAEGAGGPGAVGGGGGGRMGAGDQLRFVSVRQLPPPPLAPADAARVTPPPPPPNPPAPSTVTPDASATATAGSGTASGDVAGAGPGAGGGVGSGIGPGRGSGSGPGTGGGSADNFPPTPTQFFLPPLPAPARIRPYHLVAWFDVDERGRATLLGFNPSRDGAYNRRLRDVLLTLRFRPGTRPDGTAVRDTVDVHYIF